MEIQNQSIHIRSIDKEPTEEEMLVISTALNLYFRGGYDEHKLTIRHNNSSNWNSKLFGINQLNK